MESRLNILRALQNENALLKATNQDLQWEIQNLRNTVRALSNLHHYLRVVTPQSDAIALVQSILTSALAAVNSENGSLQLLDEATGELVFVEVEGAVSERLKGYRLTAGQGIAGWVAANRTALLVPDVNKEPRFSPAVDELAGFQTTTIICVPLVYGKRTLGVIEVVNSSTGAPFEEKDLEIMQLVALLASMVLVRAEGLA
jgi:GAF domain-containing protein